MSVNTFSIISLDGSKSCIRPYSTEYQDAYIQKQHLGNPSIATSRSQQASLDSTIKSAAFVCPQSAKNASMTFRNMSMPISLNSQPPSDSDLSNPWSSVRRTDNTVVSKLSDSSLYEPAKSWAHWRVVEDNKPADSRSKYRGFSSKP